VTRRPDGKLTFETFGAEKGPQDECGVFGVWAPDEEVAKLTFYGLYALQHRGQESAHKMSAAYLVSGHRMKRSRS